MRARLAAAAACLLFARPLAADGGRAAEVAAWLAGTYELKDQGPEGNPEAVRIVIVAVPKSRIANGGLVLYREQAAAPKLDQPTQQRFLRLEEDGDTVRMRVFDPKDPVVVRGKWRDPSALALYGASDLRERPGCTMLLRKKGDLWEGEMPGADCPSTARTAATMTSVLILAQDGFTQWDRGFDEKGRPAWKTPEAGMRFLKRSMNAPVDDKLIERPVGRRAEREGFSAKGKEGTGTAVVSPAASEAKAAGEFSSSGREGREEVAPALLRDDGINLLGPDSPSKKVTVAEIRGGSSTRVPLRRVFDFLGTPTGGAAARRTVASAVLVVTGRDGSVAAFSVDEALAPDGPELDLKDVPHLIFPRSPGRAVRDVVSIELKVLAPAK